MVRPRIAAVTCRELPEPDPDEPLLRAAIERHGGDYELVAWDGDPVDWRRYDRVVPRSTWNYYRHPAAFLEWAERADATTTLLNPLSVVRKNIHKSYLLELAKVGVPTVPTVLVERGERRALSSILSDEGWSDVVIKPAIGAASWKSFRANGATLEVGERHLADLALERDVLVQPYMQAVEDHGERSLVWIDGELTHSIRKDPRFGGADESVSDHAVPPPEGGAALLDAAISSVDLRAGEALLYARLDVVPDDDGQLVVMELELIEPSLFFLQRPAALERFAAALVARA